MTSQYGKTEYWEERYTRDPEPFDWYQKYSSLRDIISLYVNPESRILNVGSGNSKMSEQMFNEGYELITNIDISQNVIKQMQEKYKEMGTTFKYQLMDVKQMDFQDGSFDLVLDKGTLDCILCGDNSTINVEKVVNEIYRVLSNNGVYICVTYGLPESRETLFQKEKFEWDVQQKKLEKPMGNTGIAAAAEDKDPQNYHYIFICQKKLQENLS